MNLAVKAGFLCGLFLVPNVDDAGLVFTGEHHVKTGRTAMAFTKLRRALGSSAPNLFCNLLAVEYRGHVAGLAERRRNEKAQFTTTVRKETAPSAARRSIGVATVSPGFTY